MPCDYEERRKLRAENKALFDEINEILFRHDPMGISFGDNTDEYDLEVGTILPRLREADGPEKQDEHDQEVEDVDVRGTALTGVHRTVAPDTVR